MIPTSETWMNIQALKKSDLLRIYGPKYPHLKFSCPACGSFEVFISWNKAWGIDGKCLDCNYDWTETK